MSYVLNFTVAQFFKDVIIYLVHIVIQYRVSHIVSVHCDTPHNAQYCANPYSHSFYIHVVIFLALLVKLRTSWK